MLLSIIKEGVGRGISVESRKLNTWGQMSQYGKKPRGLENPIRDERKIEDLTTGDIIAINSSLPPAYYWRPARSFQRRGKLFHNVRGEA